MYAAVRVVADGNCVASTGFGAREARNLESNFYWIGNHLESNVRV